MHEPITFSDLSWSTPDSGYNRRVFIHPPWPEIYDQDSGFAY
jgi:predicted ATPase